MWLLARAACTVVSERARDGVAPCFLAEIWAQIQNESKTVFTTLIPILAGAFFVRAPCSRCKYCFRLILNRAQISAKKHGAPRQARSRTSVQAANQVYNPYIHSYFSDAPGDPESLRIKSITHVSHGELRCAKSGPRNQPDGLSSADFCAKP